MTQILKELKRLQKLFPFVSCTVLHIHTLKPVASVKQIKLLSKKIDIYQKTISPSKQSYRVWY